MLKQHGQRLTVLLFFLCGVYLILYLLRLTSINTSYIYETFYLATTGFSGCVIMDVVSLSFSAVVMYVSACVFWFACYYMSQDMFYYRFMWLLLSFVASMNILILSGSLLVLLLGWDGLGISSFALIMYYQSKESLTASFLTLMVNRLGDVVIMSSMVVFTMMGTFTLCTINASLVYPLLLLFVMAALTKSAQYPFSAWLPAAMAAPTPVSALVHSSTLVTAGVFLLVRACTVGELPEEGCSVLMLLGSVTSFIGGSCAMYENDLKKLIALSTLSQLGVMMFSLGLGLYSFALLHLYTHAMFKALLFLVAGCILLMSYGVQDIRLLGSVMKSHPFLLVLLNISAFSLMGFPFLSAYYSKHVILSSMWEYSNNIFALGLMVVSTFLSGGYMIRLLKIINWGCAGTSVVCAPQLSLWFYFPLMFLFFGSCCLGWIINTVDINYSLATHIPAGWDLTLYFASLFGAVTGVMLYKQRGSAFLSTLYYMSPVWYNLNSVSFRIIQPIRSLDKGWLEPFTYQLMVGRMLTLLSLRSAWPSASAGFSANMLLMTGLLLSLWYYLN